MEWKRERAEYFETFVFHQNLRGTREFVDPMAQPGSHHQDSPLVRSSSKRPFEGNPQEMVDSPPPNHSHPTSAVSSTTSNGPPKKRITRKRNILSCRNCTARKIRCERESGPGLPCKACTKRGEGALCDPGSTPGTSNASTS